MLYSPRAGPVGVMCTHVEYTYAHVNVWSTERTSVNSHLVVKHRHDLAGVECRVVPEVDMGGVVGGGNCSIRDSQDALHY